jgi:hypothetical protein
MIKKILNKWTVFLGKKSTKKSTIKSSKYNPDNLPRDIVLEALYEISLNGFHIFSKKMVYVEIKGILTLQQIKVVFSKMVEKGEIKRVTVLNSFEDDNVHVFYKWVNA